jgi:hypothetical protein
MAEKKYHEEPEANERFKQGISNLLKTLKEIVT